MTEIIADGSGFHHEHAHDNDDATITGKFQEKVYHTRKSGNS